MTKPLLLLAALSIPCLAAGQSRPLIDKLANVKTLRCEFTTLATVDWNKGEPVVTTKPVKLSFSFDMIDAEDGTARAVGTFGPSDIIVRLSSNTLHFVQSFREGPLYATTIFPFESKDGKLRAVHTRHEYTSTSVPGFTSRPEQYYGECEASPK